MLELDEVRLVLDVERGTEPARQRIAGDDVDVDLLDRGMGEEVAAEQRVVLHLDRASLSAALDALGAPAADAVQAEPAAALFHPALDRAALLGVRVRAGHVRDQ